MRADAERQKSLGCDRIARDKLLFVSSFRRVSLGSQRSERVRENERVRRFWANFPCWVSHFDSRRDAPMPSFRLTYEYSARLRLFSGHCSYFCYIVDFSKPCRIIFAFSWQIFGSISIYFRTLLAVFLFLIALLISLTALSNSPALSPERSAEAAAKFTRFAGKRRESSKGERRPSSTWWSYSTLLTHFSRFPNRYFNGLD